MQDALNSDELYSAFVLNYVLPRAMRKYDEDQPRDESGRWTATDNLSSKGSGDQLQLPFGPRGRGSVKRATKYGDHYLAFHGTSKQALEHIRKEGLRPGKGGGGDEWARRNGYFVEELTSRDGAKMAVFLADNEDDAVKYAQLAAEVTGSTPVLIAVHVPAEKASLFERDIGGDPHGLRAKTVIPPDWIDPIYYELTPNRRYQESLLRHKEGIGFFEEIMPAFTRAEGQRKTIYMVVLVDNGSEEGIVQEKVSLMGLLRKEFDPDQPRDEQGRWTDGGGSSAKDAEDKYPNRVGSPDFKRIEGALADKLGMVFTHTNEQGQNQFKVVDQAKFQAAVQEYSKLEDAMGGKVLNTDTARELSDDYLADRTLSAAVHEPASEFIKELYRQKLAEEPAPGQHHTVLFTAGGTGAGKSSGLELPGVKPMVDAAHIIYDTNMNTFGSADKKIAQAIQAGHDIAIVYVNRDPLDALVNGALPRAMNQEKKFGTGRTVPIKEHIKTHVGALSTVRQISEKWSSTGRIHVVGVNNSLGRGNARIEPISNFRLPDQQQMEAQLDAALEQQHNENRISESVYRGFKGSPPAVQKRLGGHGHDAGGVRQQGGAGVRQGPQRGGHQTTLRKLFDPDQPRDETGKWATAGGGERVFFEVAPDPNNAALTQRWNSLSEAERVEVSERIAGEITPEALSAAGVSGETRMQVGGYMGSTNPSLAIDVPRDQDPEKALQAANLLGYALSQDSMMVVSDKRFAGADPVGVVTVHLPGDASFAKIAATYDRLWQLEEGGQKLVGGHSTANGQMNILNFSNLSNEEFARRIDAQLGGKYTVDVRHAFVAFPQKDDYGSHLPPEQPVSNGQPAAGRYADRLRGKASAAIERELSRLGKVALGLRLRKEFVASASATSGLTAYGNTEPKKKGARRRKRDKHGNYYR